MENVVALECCGSKPVYTENGDIKTFRCGICDIFERRKDPKETKDDAVKFWNRRVRGRFAVYKRPADYVLPPGLREAQKRIEELDRWKGENGSRKAALYGAKTKIPTPAEETESPECMASEETREQNSRLGRPPWASEDFWAWANRDRTGQ